MNLHGRRTWESVFQPVAILRVVRPGTTEGSDLLADKKRRVAPERGSVKHQQVMEDDIAVAKPGGGRRGRGLRPRIRTPAREAGFGASW